MAKKQEETTEQGAVTFESLQSPKQFFSFNGGNYNFINGLFTTSDVELIAYLDENHGCKRQ